MSSDSSLLQQAIIDATALKEAAIKNAENALVEKYSHEFKQTVEKLLEQEQAAMVAPAIDPLTQAATATSPDAAAAGATAVDPTANLAADEEDESDAFSKIKSAFLDGPDDEVITINFDKLQETMMQMFEGDTELVSEEYDRTGTHTEDVAKDALSAGAPLEEDEELEEEIELEENIEEADVEETSMAGGPEGEATEEALEEKEELHEIDLDEMQVQDPAAAERLANIERQEAQLAAQKVDILKNASNVASTPNATPAASTTTAVVREEEVDEDIELSEEELMELEEQLRVDLHPESQGRGYMGTTTVEKNNLRVVELAAARDDEATKKREEEKENLKDLVKENAKLKAMNDKMILMFESLKKEVEKVNVSNAKLLYTNKALVNISLNERQKNQIVESISKADSVLAAKTIYETVQNAVENIPQKEVPQTLRETLNRASTPFVTKKNSVNNLNDFMAERMKALAGIKNNK